MMSLHQKEDQKNKLCMRLPSHPLSARLVVRLMFMDRMASDAVNAS